MRHEEDLFERIGLQDIVCCLDVMQPRKENVLVTTVPLWRYIYVKDPSCEGQVLLAASMAKLKGVCLESARQGDRSSLSFVVSYQ